LDDAVKTLISNGYERQATGHPDIFEYVNDGQGYTSRRTSSEGYPTLEFWKSSKQDKADAKIRFDK
jgi:hypothetical protein